MGKTDVAVKQWLDDGVRFADLFNGILFNGEQIINANELEKVSGESSIILADKEKKEKYVHRYRDIVKRWKGGIDFVILAVEAQSKVHYSMPVRNMVYDGLSYTGQIREIWDGIKDEEKKRLTSEEVFSRFRRSDKLVPVITIVLYTGSDKWDGALNLHEMFDIKDNRFKSILDKYVPDYRINLVNIMNMEDTAMFRSDLQMVFDMLKYKENKEKMKVYTRKNSERLRRLDIETVNVIKYLLNAGKSLEKIIDNNKKVDITGKERVDMCKALDEWYKEGIEEGIEQGIEQGIAISIRTLQKNGFTKAMVLSSIKENAEIPELTAADYIEKYWMN